MDKKRLLSYAEWYYTKFFPSLSMLEKKLREKWADTEQIEEIFTRISPLFCETENLTSRIREYVGRGKWKKYIFSNLIRKGFKKEKITEIFEQEFQEEYEKNSQETIQIKIISYLEKNNSKIQVFQKVYEKYPDKKNIIQEFLDEKFPEYEQESISYWLEKYSNLSDQEKIKKLLSKGFQYGVVKQVLEK